MQPCTSVELYLALFDFDGTIRTRDSYLLFTGFLDRKRYLLGCLVLAPRIIGYLARIYPHQALKEDFLKYFYRGKTTDEIQLLAYRFCSQEIAAIIRPEAMARIRWHQGRGDTVVVVSACPRLILEPWCREIDVDIIATELGTDRESRVTGKIAGKNCRGQEKVNRIQAMYELNKYDSVFAYGDSRGDLPMLELADQDKRFFKPFR